MLKLICLFASFFLANILVLGQDTDTLPAYPCTINVPSLPSFIYCENGKEVKCQNFKAMRIRNQIRISASKPENSVSIFPMIIILFKADTVQGMHKSERDKINSYFQKNEAGDNSFTSRMHSGFSDVYITTYDEEYISGKFAAVAFDKLGSKGQLFSGAFKVPFKKE